MLATKTMLSRREEKPSNEGMPKDIAMAAVPDPEGLFCLSVLGAFVFLSLRQPHCSRAEENEIRPLPKSSIQNRSKIVGSQPIPIIPGAAASVACATPSDSARSGI